MSGILIQSVVGCPLTLEHRDDAGWHCGFVCVVLDGRTSVRAFDSATGRYTLTSFLYSPRTYIHSLRLPGNQKGTPSVDPPAPLILTPSTISRADLIDDSTGG